MHLAHGTVSVLRTAAAMGRTTSSCRHRREIRMIAVLKRLVAWLRDDGCFVLDGPVIVQDGSAWLRIAPGEQVRWYPDERSALAA
jgi:hypothetical protein